MTVVASVPPSGKSLLCQENMKQQPQSHCEAFLKGTSNFGKRLLGISGSNNNRRQKHQQQPRMKVVKSSGYGRDQQQQRRKMFQPQTNNGKYCYRKSEQKTRQPRNPFNSDGGVNGGGEEALLRSLEQTVATNSRARWSKRKVEEGENGDDGSRGERWTKSVASGGGMSRVEEESSDVCRSVRMPSSRFCSSVRIWSTDGAKTRVSFCPPSGGGGRGNGGGGGGGSVLAASSSTDHTVQIVPSGSNYKTSPSIGFTLSGGHLGPVRSLDFSHGGDLLATAGEDRLVRVWRWRERAAALDVDSRGGAGAGAGAIDSAALSSVAYGSSKRRGGNPVLILKKSSVEPTSARRESIFPDLVVRSQFFYLDQFLLTASSNKVFAH